MCVVHAKRFAVHSKLAVHADADAHANGGGVTGSNPALSPCCAYMRYEPRM